MSSTRSGEGGDRTGLMHRHLQLSFAVIAFKCPGLCAFYWFRSTMRLVCSLHPLLQSFSCRNLHAPEIIRILEWEFSSVYKSLQVFTRAYTNAHICAHLSARVCKCSQMSTNVHTVCVYQVSAPSCKYSQVSKSIDECAQARTICTLCGCHGCLPSAFSLPPGPVC